MAHGSAKRSPARRMGGAGHVSVRRTAMGDTRDAGRARLSPQWEMVFARFDDLARQVAMIETARIQDGRENRAEFQELRDQIQRTRDEVAQASAQAMLRLEDDDSAIVELINGVADRVDHLESTRKRDVREVVRETTPAVLAKAARRAPHEAWAGLLWPSKTGAIVGAFTVMGTLIAGVLDGAPKAATLAWKVITALADKPST